MEGNKMQEHEIRKVCAKFWAGIFAIVMISGIGIGMVGKSYIKTPPYMKLITENKNDQIVEAFNKLSDKVDNIDSRVQVLEKK